VFYLAFSLFMAGTWPQAVFQERTKFVGTAVSTGYDPVPLIQASRTALDTVAQDLDIAALTAPGVEGEWSIKDILAHIAAWEARLTVWLEAALRGERAARPEPGLTWDAMDDLNEQTYLANRERPLTEVQEEARATYARMLQTVRTCMTQLSPDAFERVPAGVDDTPLKFQIAANTYEHYDEHLANIQAWLSSRSA
jgi:hypothetical protein